MKNPVPVLLFVYRRPAHVTRILECLRADRVPLLCVFSDAASGAEDAESVDLVRQIVREVDWTELRLYESPRHLGLGTSILGGVSRMFEEFESLIVLEDDLVFTPGTYEFLTAGLTAYASHPEVMSLTAWTHPRVVPDDVTDQPYFDGRAECWSWATWRRSWEGMQAPAAALVREARAKGIDVNRFGTDVPRLAAQEARRNTWASRWLLLHILRGGLCVRPAWSLVDHEPSAELATNVANDWTWAQTLRENAPPLPQQWPTPQEHPQVAQLWRKACARRLRRLIASIRTRIFDS